MAFDAFPDVRQADARRFCGRCHEAGVLRLSGHHARHHHGLLSVHGGSNRRLRKFPDPASNRRARHGVSFFERALVLGVFAVLYCHLFCPLRRRRRATGRLDGVCPAKRCTRGRTRTGNGPHALDYSHSALHRVGLDGRFELHYDNPHDANARPVDDAAPADAVVVVDYSHSGFARFSSASRRRNLADIRPGGRDQLLCSSRNHHEPNADRPFRRPPAVMAASILVLRAS